jgi:hypothetical protein
VSPWDLNPTTATATELLPGALDISAPAAAADAQLLRAALDDLAAAEDAAHAAAATEEAAWAQGHGFGGAYDGGVGGRGRQRGVQKVQGAGPGGRKLHSSTRVKLQIQKLEEEYEVSGVG